MSYNIFTGNIRYLTFTICLQPIYWQQFSKLFYSTDKTHLCTRKHYEFKKTRFLFCFSLCFLITSLLKSKKIRSTGRGHESFIFGYVRARLRFPKRRKRLEPTQVGYQLRHTNNALSNRLVGIAGIWVVLCPLRIVYTLHYYSCRGRLRRRHRFPIPRRRFHSWGL